MEGKKSFVLYFDAYDHLKALPAEQRGELLLALFEYAKAAAQGQGEPEETAANHPAMTGETRMAFSFLAQTIRRDTEQWPHKQARCSQAARERKEQQRTPSGNDRIHEEIRRLRAYGDHVVL